MVQNKLTQRLSTVLNIKSRVLRKEEKKRAFSSTFDYITAITCALPLLSDNSIFVGFIGPHTCIKFHGLELPLESFTGRVIAVQVKSFFSEHGS